MNLLLQGRRISSDYPKNIRPGDYWFDIATKHWMAACPNNLGEEELTIVNLFDVTEFDDGTISVMSPVLVMNGEKTYRGYLKHGTWTPA